MKTICSVQNDSIKRVASLHSSKGRFLHNQYIAEGLRVLERFAAAQKTPIELYVTEPLYTDARIIFKKSDPIVVPEHVMKKISPSVTPPGILAIFDFETISDSISLNAKGLVLANITDPGNMGTLIRSAAACGHKLIVIVEGVDPYSPKVIQATAGAFAHTTIVKLSWSQLVAYKNRFPLCAMATQEGCTIQDLPTKNVLLVVGNEAHGLPQEWIKECDYVITIPMDGSTESLNAAVAGSIGLFLLKK